MLGKCRKERTRIARDIHDSIGHGLTYRAAPSVALYVADECRGSDESDDSLDTDTQPDRAMKKPASTGTQPGFAGFTVGKAKILAVCGFG